MCLCVLCANRRAWAQWCNDACLARYLRARVDKFGWNLEKSLAMIQDTLKWRREFKPESIKEEVRTALNNCSPTPDLSSHDRPTDRSINQSQDVKELIEMGMLYNNGKDKQGRPIVMVKFKYAASPLLAPPPFRPAANGLSVRECNVVVTGLSALVRAANR